MSEIFNDIKQAISSKTSFYLTFPDGGEEEFIDWLAQSETYWSSSQERIGIQDQPIIEFFGLLAEPWIKLKKLYLKQKDAVQNNEENTSIEYVNQIKATISEIAAGRSASFGSQAQRILDNQGLSNFAKWGFIFTIFKAHLNGKVFKLLRPVVSVNNRSEFIFGAHLANLVTESRAVSDGINLQHLFSISDEFKQTANEASAKIADIDSSWSDFLDQRDLQIEQADEHIKKVILRRAEAYKEIAREHRNEMRRIRRTYKDLLALKDAVTHWNTRANNNRNLAYFALILFFAIAGGSLWTLFNYGPNIFEQFLAIANEHKITPSPLLFLAFVSVPSAILLWAVRFPSKLFTEHLRISNDARFRQTLISTYLSLLRDESNPVKVEERHFALKTIFGQLEKAAPEDQLNISVHDLITQKPANS